MRLAVLLLIGFGLSGCGLAALPCRVGSAVISGPVWLVKQHVKWFRGR